ncbi:type I-E CRISPR-associated protein Cse2/CasB [Actinokineospora auranticolor]|uniref:CRISPR system Cascade subunit CasB n=1 Tax=Actinokineospora auranticolor TaxID=155976 RepID=A0A2S6GF41_9PSEU|nr:type I-E CRISPR-associated protein Cse2/CasB [Actinokineospora auranticolor]PPK63771.1 CRISPR system Cascade subunit CasB [Actinokineospora auranticolor]
MTKPRESYVNHLYGLGNCLTSRNSTLVARSRRDLALLRNSFVPGRQFAAYEIVFRNGAPDDEVEQEVWLLVGALYALHPLTKGARGTLGASMGQLAKKIGDGSSVGRRFAQLLARDRAGLPHHLRQAVRLLSAHSTPVNYHRLLDDLTVLLGRDHLGDRAGAIRLRWAREYHVAPTTDTPETTQ